MSFLPAPFTQRAEADGDSVLGRHPVVHILGDMAVAEQRWHQFANAYKRYVDTDGRHTVHRSPMRRFSFPTGDTMSVISQGSSDFVTITVVSAKYTPPKIIEGFLITPMSTTKPLEPDRSLAEVYRFGFDDSKFSSYVAPDFIAGDLRHAATQGKYISWDGTGGGNLAHEEEFTRSAAITTAETSLAEAEKKAWTDAVAKAIADQEDPADLNQIQIVSSSPEVIVARSTLERAKLVGLVSRQTALVNPGIFSMPYASLSGDLYCEGKRHHVLDGLIHGMRTNGGTIYLADFADNTTVRIHQAAVNADGSVGYVGMLGKAEVPVKGVVNFSEDLKSCVVLSTLIELTGSFSAGKVFKTTQIVPAENSQSATADRVVRAGFKGNDLKFTLTETANAGGMTNFCPHDFSEYTLPWDNNPWNVVTYGHRTEQRDYFDASYKPGWVVPDNPDWQRKYDQTRVCTVIKKPIIVFQGFYPTTAYTWMRTVSQMTISDENKLYWYKDYDTGDYVRCAWSIGYVATQNYEQYGAFEPDESAVVSGRAISVGGMEDKLDEAGKVVLDANGAVVRVAWANVLTGSNAASNWFYAVTNSQGDYVLRTQPNGIKSDALLVSRKGVTKRIKDTYSVGII